jgi:TetR/AcrR family transcriptional repressor of nem operon
MKKKKNPEKSRNDIIDSALTVIYQKGFKAASINEILMDTGLTKGALYHHFPNKNAVGYAILDRVRDMIQDTWLTPLEGHPDPITGLQETMLSAGAELNEADIMFGCPLNNLAQEMSAIDEDFRKRFVELYDFWQNGIAAAIRRGQQNGTVAKTADPVSTATFFVAALTGGRGLAKTTQNIGILVICADCLIRYLESLRTSS